MDWKAKALTLVVRVKNAVVRSFNFVFDPPPAAIKWYLLAVLVIAVGGGIVGAKLRGSAPEKRSAAAVHLIPRLPSVVTTTLPPPRSKELNALTLYKAKDMPGKKTVKRKKKCDAVFC